MKINVDCFTSVCREVVHWFPVALTDGQCLSGFPYLLSPRRRSTVLTLPVLNQRAHEWHAPQDPNQLVTRVGHDKEISDVGRPNFQMSGAVMVLDRLPTRAVMRCEPGAAATMSVFDLASLFLTATSLLFPSILLPMRSFAIYYTTLLGFLIYCGKHDLKAHRVRTFGAALCHRQQVWTCPLYRPCSEVQRGLW